MGRNVVETLMGFLVLLVAASFVFISYKSGNITAPSDQYTIKARFREIGSLVIGSDIRVGGIKVGTISNATLDPTTYMAILDLSINKLIKLPKDSTAIVQSDGLIGGKYLSIEPGGDDVLLQPGEEIKYTQDSVSLESLIGKFAFGSVGKTDETENKENSSDGGLK